MKLENQPVYYLPSVKFKEDFLVRYLPKNFHKDSIYPIEIDNNLTSFDPHKEIQIISHDEFHCNIIPISLDKVELLCQLIVPKYKLGDIVVKKDARDECGIFRIYEYTLLQGKIWCRDSWSVATDLEGGVFEENLRLATDEEKTMWPVKSGDDLVKTKKPDLYNLIVRK